MLKIVAGIILALLVPVAGTVMTDAPVIWPISTAIYNLGLLLVFAATPRSALKIIAYNVVAAVFFLVESSFFFSYYLQNDGFNAAFFYHIRPDLVFAGVREHLPVLLAMVLCMCGFLALSSSALARERGIKTRLFPIALGLLTLGIVISPSARSLFLYAKTHSQAFAGGDLFEKFPELRDPKVTVEFSKSKRPNIVLIYAESLEQRFFDEAVFPDLVPNLKRIKQQSVDFLNVAQGVGAGWTIAGMVASQCGYPLFGSHDVGGNSLSMFDEFLPKASCLGDLLEKDGYRMTFIGGADARFAGKKDFLESHGYSEILDRDYLLKFLEDKTYRNDWGIFDDTLFDYAIKKFRTLSIEKSPFLLTLLTLDTHHPDGFPSKSCGTYGSGDNTTLNAVHCSDQLISNFIERIRNSPYSENTIIIVLSDHLAMRNQATPLLRASKMPGLLTFFVNTPDGKEADIRNPGLHYDISPTILDLAGYHIKGQMGFGEPLTRGPGYLPGRFGADEWKKETPSLVAIGSTLWNNDVVLDRDGIKFRESDRSLAMGGREFDLHANEGYSNAIMSAIFIFDGSSLKLEKIRAYPIDQKIEPETISKELLKNREKLVLAMSRAKYLPGFSDPRTYPDQMVFFCGKPGSDYFSWGPVTGDLFIPFDLIQNLRKSNLDDRAFNEREKQVKALEVRYRN